ncbi:MAG: 50S ribosomal protein L30 [Acidobacteriota bacterium]
MAEGKKIKVQWYRSTICTPKTHKAMVRALGFRKLNQTLERPDNAATRGVVAKVPHLLRIVEE